MEMLEMTETMDWPSVIAGGLAVLIILGGMTMMFTTAWTRK